MYKETHSENSTRVRWHSRLKRDTVKLITGLCFILALFRKWQHEKIKKKQIKKGEMLSERKFVRLVLMWADFKACSILKTENRELDRLDLKRSQDSR